jgi:hypothetical protein
MDWPKTIAVRAENHYRNFFDNELGSCKRRTLTCHFIAGEQCIFDDP